MQQLSSARWAGVAAVLMTAGCVELQTALTPRDSDTDPDRDGVLSTRDNCPNVFNADQADADGDNIGDRCDPDAPPANSNSGQNTNQNEPDANSNANANTNANLNGDENTNAGENANASPNDNAGGNINANANANANTNDNASPAVPTGEVLEIVNEGAEHVPVGTTVTYVANPPASGMHWSEFGIAPIAAGVYTREAIRPERWVHNLEHGYVVLLFDCDNNTCDDGLVDDLAGTFDTFPPSSFGNVKLVVTRYDGLPHAIAAVAWDFQLFLDSFDASALLDFYSRFVDNGPEDLP